MPQDKVNPPGIILMCIAGINMMIQMLQIAYYGLIGSIGLLAPPSQGSQSQDEQLVFILVIAFSVVAALFAIAWNGAIGYAGWKMRKFESYTWCMVGAILAIIPCGGCCLLNMPAGIYALVILNDQQVKDHFVS